MGGSLQSRELSQKLGMSKDYLCVYRSFNKHLKSYEEAYNEVIKRREYESKLLSQIQAIYYELIDTKSINKFARHLVDIGIYSNSMSLHRVLNKSFLVRLSLVQKENLKLYETIIREHGEWKLLE